MGLTVNKVKWSYPKDVEEDQRTGRRTTTSRSFELDDCSTEQLTAIVNECIKDGYDVEVNLNCKVPKE